MGFAISRKVLHGGDKISFIDNVVKKGKRELDGFGDSDTKPKLCEAHKYQGKEWMVNELCVNKKWREGENRDGYDIGGKNLCEECSGPTQLCYDETMPNNKVASCSDYLLKCQALTEDEKKKAAAEYERVKKESPEL